MLGIYQHCSSQFLQRYLREFDFRYTYRSANGIEGDQCAAITLKGIAANASPIGGLVQSGSSV